MKFAINMAHRGSHFKIEGATGYCNMGELCESIIKHHLGLPYLHNPNTPGLEGYDIPELKAEVKSGESGLGRAIGDPSFNQSQQLSYYFKHSPWDKTWIWAYFNLKTMTMTEYHMNKSEFGSFIHIALRSKQHLQSNKKSVNVRFKKTSKKMLAWLDARVEATAV